MGTMGRHLLAISVLLVALVGCSIRPPTPPPTPTPPSTRPSVPGPTASAEPTTSASPSIAVVPNTSPPPGQLVGFERARLSDGDRLLTLDFTGGRPFSPADPCSHMYAGWAEQVGDVIQAAVVDVTPPWPAAPGSTPVACDASGHPRTVAIELAEPFLGAL